MKGKRRLSRVVSIVGVVIVGLATMGPGQAADMPTGSAIAVPISPDGIQRATVLLDSYSYSPNYVIVEHGKPVELTLTSVTVITPHNFIIKDLTDSLSVEQDVGAGQTVMARFVPTRPGLFSFFCDKRLWPMRSHRDKGMEGMLEVK
ncbi:MAG TPA: cupredoxin domain-containing protein [Nitrospira sp.]|nr:cupredoxin domain-containing protein [Nitrospira sp.]